LNILSDASIASKFLVHLDTEEVTKANLSDIIADVLVVEETGTADVGCSGDSLRIGLKMSQSMRLMKYL
jgi:hypothetical protein